MCAGATGRPLASYTRGRIILCGKGGVRYGCYRFDRVNSLQAHNGLRWLYLLTWIYERYGSGFVSTRPAFSSHQYLWYYRPTKLIGHSRYLSLPQMGQAPIACIHCDRRFWRSFPSPGSARGLPRASMMRPTNPPSISSAALARSPCPNPTSTVGAGKSESSACSLVRNGMTSIEPLFTSTVTCRPLVYSMPTRRATSSCGNLPNGITQVPRRWVTASFSLTWTAAIGATVATAPN